MTGRLARITQRAPDVETAPLDAPDRRDRSRWIPVAVLAVAALVIVALVLTGQDDDEPAPTDTTASTEAGGFTVDAGDGSLTFDQDDDEASVAFQGPDEEGQFSFDLDGDGVVAQGEGGRFELDGGTPPAWPRDFPVVDGATVVRGSVLDAGDVVQLSTTYRSAKTPEALVAFYLDALADDAPLVEEPPADSPPGAIMISFEGRWTGFISVGQTAAATIVAVQLYSEPVPAS